MSHLVLLTFTRACVEKTFMGDLTAEELEVVEMFVALCHRYEVR